MGIIPRMSSSKWIIITLVLLFGIALGLIYGWVLDPVEYTDVTPNILREDYRVDYVLMVAEAYQHDLNADQANRRLAVLGSETPVSIITSALEYASQNEFSPAEIEALQELLAAMQTHPPQGNDNP